MRKMYRIDGKASVRPEDLPEGLEVVEIEERFTADIPDGLSSGHQPKISLVEQVDQQLYVAVVADDDYPMADVILSHDAAVRLRDALNEFLNCSEEQPETRLRVFRAVLDDDYGDAGAWFEVRPNWFRSPVIEDWISARELDEKVPWGGLTFEDLEYHFQYLTDVTDQYSYMEEETL